MRKTKKESYACTPSLVRINTIEGKVRASHVHALAARLESRDRSFCQLTSVRRLLGQLRLLTADPWQGHDKTRSYRKRETFDSQKSRNIVPCIAKMQLVTISHNNLQVTCNYIFKSP